jgi:hypothetical protein
MQPAVAVPVEVHVAKCSADQFAGAQTRRVPKVEQKT